MARAYRTSLIIEGDSKGGIRAVKATESELAKLDAANARSASRQSKAAATMTRGYRDIASTISRTSGAIAALGAGAAIGGLVSLTARQAEAAQQADNLARTVGTTAGEIQGLGYAFEQAGLGADKAADVVKDLTEKIGDAALSGGGELADVLNRIGLSAETLQEQNPTEQLETIGQAIAGLPRAQQVNVLESIADDGARLLPLLDNGAEALRRYTDQAVRFGVALSDADNAKLVEANANMQELRGLATGVSNQFAIAMSPAIDEAAGHADDLAAIFKEDEFKDGVATIASGVGNIATAAARSVSEIGKLANAISNFDIGGIASFAASRTGPGYLYGKLFGGDNEPVPAAPGPVSTTTVTAPRPNTPPAAQGAGAATGLLATYDKENRQLEKLKADRRKLQAAMAEDPANVDAYRRAITEVDSQIQKLGQSNARAATKMTEAQKAAERLQSSFESERESLARRIALYDDNSQAAQTLYELEKGSLQGLSAERQKTLTQMASQLDMLDRQKQAVAELFPEFEQLERASQLRASVSDLPTDMQAFGQQRADALARDTATQGLPGMQGLDPQYNGAFGEAQRLGSERDTFQGEYERRRQAYLEYARLHQEDKQTADAAIEALDQEHQRRMLQYDQQIGQARRQGFQSVYSDLTSVVGTFAGQQSGIYQSMFAISKGYAVSNALVSMYQGAAEALKLPFPANIAAGAAVIAQGASLVSNISGVSPSISGQAHDGIDSVPNSGTWNLEKGERVVDARMNRDLSRYLKQQTTNNTTNDQSRRAVTIHNEITVQGQPGQSAEESRRQGQAVGEAMTQKIRTVLVDERRPGGILYRT